MPTENPATAIAATRFIFIRHGETAWNVERRIQGHANVALNPLGQRQAQLLADQLSREGLGKARLYCSDLRRARQTAEAISQALAIPVMASRELRERSYGIFEGLTYDEAKQRYPEEYAAFEQRRPEQALPGGGESLQHLATRIGSTIDDLRQGDPGVLRIVVTHGGVLDIVHRRVRRQALSAKRDFPIPNAAINRLTATATGWQIDTWAETSHLDAAALDELGRRR